MGFIKNLTGITVQARWAIIFIILSHYMIPVSLWMASSVTILLSTLAFRYRGLVLQLSPFLFVASLSSKGMFFFKLSRTYNYDISIGLVYSALAFLAFCYTMHLFCKYVKAFQIIILSCFFAFCFYLIGYFESATLKFAVTSYVFFLQSGFWYFILTYGEKNIMTSGVFFTRFNLPHMVSQIPIPPQFLVENDSKNFEEFLKAQKNAVYSILTAIILRFFYKAAIGYYSLSEDVFGELFHLNYTNTETRGFFESLVKFYAAYGTPGKWFATYTMSFLIIINTLTFSCIAVAYYQCLGFNIPYFIKPISSVRYFHDFFGALYRYYNKAIVSIFYIRFFKQLSFLRRQHQSMAAVFFTIFVGGWFFSTEKDILKSGKDLIQFLMHSFHGMPYFFILACCCSVSVALQQKLRKRNKTQSFKLSSIFRVIIFFLLFGFMLSFRLLINFKGMSTSEVFQVLKSLFN